MLTKCLNRGQVFTSSWIVSKFKGLYSPLDSIKVKSFSFLDSSGVRGTLSPLEE